MATHEFRCPGCGRSCLLNQWEEGEGKKSVIRRSLQHALPTCETYEKTKRDGTKFVELAFLANPVAKEFKLVKSGTDGGETT